MASYIEEKDLVVDVWYECETYDGEKLDAKYVGDADFLTLEGDCLSLVGDIRYAFRAIGNFISRPGKRGHYKL